MDWSALERHHGKENDNQIKIKPKRVTVRKDQIRQLPDGTTIVIPDKNN